MDPGIGKGGHMSASTTWFPVGCPCARATGDNYQISCGVQTNCGKQLQASRVAIVSDDTIQTDGVLRFRELFTRVSKNFQTTTSVIFRFLCQNCLWPHHRQKTIDRKGKVLINFSRVDLFHCLRGQKSIAPLASIEPASQVSPSIEYIHLLGESVSQDSTPCKLMIHPPVWEILLSRKTFWFIIPVGKFQTKCINRKNGETSKMCTKKLQFIASFEIL